jgi:hypothetical protein
VIGSVVGAAVLIAIGVLLYRHQPNTVAGETMEQKGAAADTLREVQEIPGSRLQYPDNVPLSGRLGNE